MGEFGRERDFAGGNLSGFETKNPVNRQSASHFLFSLSTTLST